MLADSIESGRLNPLGRSLRRSREWLLVIYIAAIPFESVRPILEGTVPGSGGFGRVSIGFTSLELLFVPLLLLHLLDAAGDFVGRARVGGLRVPFRDSVTVWVGFAVAASLSALFAPEFRVDSVKYVSRIWSLVALLWIVRRQVRESGTRLAFVLVGALSMSGLLGAAIGVFEVFGRARLESFFAWFQLGPSLLAGQIRLSGTFLYTTVASAFFEMLVPLALALAVCHRRWTRGAWFLVAVASTVAVVLTWTRSGILALALLLGTLLLVGAFESRLRIFLKAVPVLLVVLMTTFAVLVVGTDQKAARLRTENELSWSRASYSVADTLRGVSGEWISVDFELENTGRATWTLEQEHPFRLEGLWISADSEERLDLPLITVDLAEEIAAGVHKELRVPIELPEHAGRYRISWGMTRAGMFHFRHRDVPEARSWVLVDGTEARTVEPGMGRDEGIAILGPIDGRDVAAWAVPRQDLWRAAISLWRDRPLLGIGPGVYRLRYGEKLGGTAFDERIHANNLYLQILCENGALGFLLFFGALASVLLRTHSIVLLDSRRLALGVGLGSALFVFLVHGLTDFFLAFLPILSMFGLLLGLLLALVEDEDEDENEAVASEARP